jgi:hypothetical protein
MNLISSPMEASLFILFLVMAIGLSIVLLGKGN